MTGVSGLARHAQRFVPAPRTAGLRTQRERAPDDRGIPFSRSQRPGVAGVSGLARHADQGFSVR